MDVADVVEETELEAAREAEGVGSPRESGWAWGEGWAWWLVDVRNSSQDVESLLVVPFVAINTESEYVCRCGSVLRERTI